MVCLPMVPRKRACNRTPIVSFLDRAPFARPVLGAVLLGIGALTATSGSSALANDLAAGTMRSADVADAPMMEPQGINAADAITLFQGGAGAGSESAGGVPWYIVGSFDHPTAPQRRAGAGRADDLLAVDDLMSRQLRIDFNYGGGDQANVLSITEGESGQGATGLSGTGGYTMMFTGSYGLRTGTSITPRVSAGVGLSSRIDGGGGGVGLPSQNPGRADAVAPAFQLGLGADYEVTDNWAFSAEYRAFYEGATESETRTFDPRLSQQFTVGAKIRF